MDICCRICRRKKLERHFSLDYKSGFYNITVLNMMQSLTGLEGTLGDSLPQQICRTCMGTLVAGYELKQLCIESYAYFQKTDQKDSQEQKLPQEENLHGDEINGIDLESCLTLGQIKLEPFVDDNEAETDLGETGNNHKDKEIESSFYCCFPNCSINYQFEELLIEHAASDHQLEKKANAAKSGESEFYCIVCARSFRDEVKLLEHRNRKRAVIFRCSECEYQTEVKALFTAHNRAHSKKEKVCSCGYRTSLKFSFKRHQAKCMPSKRRVRQQKCNALQEHIADDRTNDEIVAMGFLMSRATNMFYCCLPHCATVCLTQQQLSDHFQATHPEVRRRNLKVVSDSAGMVQCPICFRKLPSKKALQIHLEDSSAPSFRCNTCRYNCNSRTIAILHAATSCVAKMHRCSCGYKTSQLLSMKRHIRDNGCPLEGGTLKRAIIRRRESNKLTKRVHECKYCDKVFSTPEILQRHMELELSSALVKQEAHDAGTLIDGSDQKQYTCHWCKAVVDDDTHLVQCMLNSEKTPGQNQLYKCIKCRKRFKLYSQYMEHSSNLLCCTGSWLSCKHCDESFSNKNALAKHLTEKHLKSDRFNTAKRFECEECLQCFTTVYSRNRHRKNIHSEANDIKETSENANERSPQ